MVQQEIEKGKYRVIITNPEILLKQSKFGFSKLLKTKEFTDKIISIILDEAHFVRNRSTNASKTVALVRSKYRWMLTGTPVINSLADIYGLLRFGKFRPWNDWVSFNEHVAKRQNDDAPVAGLRAQEILKPILLRRCKNAQLEGEPLLKLPPKHINIVTHEFSSEEREVRHRDCGGLLCRC